MSTLTEDEVREKLLGAWQLVAIESVFEDGTTKNNMGEHPIGQIAYLPQGRMTAHLQHGDRAPFASSNPADASDSEVVAAFRTHTAYFGSFTIDMDEVALTHHVLGASSPTMMGTDQVRYFTFEDDRLILRAVPPTGPFTRVTWRRVV
jgi:hypothetical protein